MHCKYIDKQGNPCTRIPLKSNYCSRHKKQVERKVERQMIIDNFQKRNGIKKAEAKMRSSIFLITLNSNKSYDKMTEAERKKFENFAKYLFNKHNILKYVTDRTNPKDVSKNLKSIDTRFQYEVGPTSRKYHLHGIVKIEHSGMYWIDQAKMRNVAKDVLGYNIHLNIAVTKDSSLDIENYIQKMMLSKT